MKAITLWQPYASLVAIKAKPFETRAYPPPAKLIGERIAIHAAVRPARLTVRLMEDATFFSVRDALSKGGYRFDLISDLEVLPHGAVVCTAILAGAYQCDESIFPGRVEVIDYRGPTYLERDSINMDPFGDYSPGRWAWLLTDVRPLDPPVPAKGKQGWWEWDEGRVAA